MNNPVHALKGVLSHLYDSEILYLMAVLWGLVLLLPASTFGGSPGFSVMAQVMSESAWGSYGLAAGTLGFVSSKNNQSYWQRVSVVAMIVLWGLVAASVLLAAPFSTAGPVYLTLTAFWIKKLLLGRSKPV